MFFTWHNNIALVMHTMFACSLVWLNRSYYLKSQLNVKCVHQRLLFVPFYDMIVVSAGVSLLTQLKI